MNAVDTLPVQIAVHDRSLERSRWTVAFRLILAIPHLLWLSLWGFGAVLLLPVAWIVVLATGELPRGLHDFFAMLVRYATHVYAYVSLAADPYPGFLGEAGRYPIDVVVAPPARQRRWTVALRGLLALPPLLLATALVGGSSGGLSGSQAAGLLVVVALLAWFAILVRGRMPAGFEDVQIYCVAYAAQAYGYLLLLTDRFPDSAPAHVRPASPPPHPVTVDNRDPLRRSRLTVAFRLLLALPHLVWLTLWAVLAMVAAIAAWIAALAVGRVPAPLHRFLARFVRYGAHLSAFVSLAANPFPGFTGATHLYPLVVDIAPPAPQARWITLLRGVLAVPALMVATTLSSVASLASVAGWVVSLLLGRMPPGLRDLATWSVAYGAQVSAYLLLLTDRYPYSGPPPQTAPGAPRAAVAVEPVPA